MWNGWCLARFCFPFFFQAQQEGRGRRKYSKLVEMYSVQAACVVPCPIALMRQTMHFALLWWRNMETELLCSPELQTWKTSSSEVLCACILLWQGLAEASCFSWTFGDSSRESILLFLQFSMYMEVSSERGTILIYKAVCQKSFKFSFQ